MRLHFRPKLPLGREIPNKSCFREQNLTSKYLPHYLCQMENLPQQDAHIPPDCFTQEALELFQSFENETLAAVHYYPWLNLGENADTQPFRFLLALELVFESGNALLLSAGEDSEVIQIITAENLLEMASRLQQLHGQPTIQRLLRSEQGFWPKLLGKTLQSIQLSRHQNGLYRNDALMLDFGNAGVVVELQEAEEGLLIREV
jgi:hypothetical protein